MSTRPQIIVEADAIEKGPRFLGVLERWYDKPHWRCSEGHVSTMYIKMEEHGYGPRCAGCIPEIYKAAHPSDIGVIWLTFPEDAEGVSNEELLLRHRKAIGSGT